MISKRVEQIVIHQGQPYYQRDAGNIATVIQEELEVQIDEVTEQQATGLINITGMTYEMGLIAGIELSEKINIKRNRIVSMN